MTRIVLADDHPFLRTGVEGALGSFGIDIVASVDNGADALKAIEREDGALRIEYAGLARGEDPGLDAAVAEVARRHTSRLGLKLAP